MACTAFAQSKKPLLPPELTRLQQGTNHMSTQGNRELIGGCACGNVRYQLSSEPMYVHCCHCRSCQRETGAAYALNAIIEADRVNILDGTPEIIATPSDSGNDQKIMRCPDCHVALWSHYAGPDIKVCFVRVGTLDNPDLLPPDIQIFTRSKQPWVPLSADIPSVDVYYDPEELWPDESLARRKAVAW
jgi:hypothetical protein